MLSSNTAVFVQPFVRFRKAMQYTFPCNVRMAFERQNYQTTRSPMTLHGSIQSLTLKHQCARVIIRLSMDEQQRPYYPVRRPAKQASKLKMTGRSIFESVTLTYIDLCNKCKAHMNGDILWYTDGAFQNVRSSD